MKIWHADLTNLVLSLQELEIHPARDFCLPKIWGLFFKSEEKKDNIMGVFVALMPQISTEYTWINQLAENVYF